MRTYPLGHSLQPHLQGHYKVHEEQNRLLGLKSSSQLRCLRTESMPLLFLLPGLCFKGTYFPKRPKIPNGKNPQGRKTCNLYLHLWLSFDGIKDHDKGLRHTDPSCSRAVCTLLLYLLGKIARVLTIHLVSAS